jgi:hypothetical protein
MELHYAVKQYLGVQHSQDARYKQTSELPHVLNFNRTITMLYCKSSCHQCMMYVSTRHAQTDLIHAVQNNLRLLQAFYPGDKNENEIGGACSADGGGERRVQGFGEKT